MLTMILCLLLVTATEIAFAASPGKWIVGLAIRTPTAHPAPRWRLLLRWAIKYAPWILAAPAVILGETRSRVSPGGYYGTVPLIAWAVSSSEAVANAAFWAVLAGCVLALLPSRRALHDLLAGTAVFEAAQLRDAEGTQHAFEVSPLAPRPPDSPPAAPSR